MILYRKQLLYISSSVTLENLFHGLKDIYHNIVIGNTQKINSIEHNHSLEKFCQI